MSDQATKAEDSDRKPEHPVRDPVFGVNSNGLKALPYDRRTWPLVLLTSILVCLSPIACSKTAPSGQSVAKTQVPATKAVLKELGLEDFGKLVRDTSTFLVNVQMPHEGEIPGTDISLPYESVVDSLRAVEPDQTRVVAIYCRTGKQSREAGLALAKAGYTNVCLLQGGYKAWVSRGLPFTVVPGRPAP